MRMGLSKLEKNRGVAFNSEDHFDLRFPLGNDFFQVQVCKGSGRMAVFRNKVLIVELPVVFLTKDE
jgi:hypothetical protein